MDSFALLLSGLLFKPLGGRLRVDRNGRLMTKFPRAGYFCGLLKRPPLRLGFASEQPRNRNFEAIGNRANLIIHHIPLAILHFRQGCLRNLDSAPCQLPRQIILRNRRLHRDACKANPLANDVFEAGCAGSFQPRSFYGKVEPKLFP